MKKRRLIVVAMAAMMILTGMASTAYAASHDYSHTMLYASLSSDGTMVTYQCASEGCDYANESNQIRIRLKDSTSTTVTYNGNPYEAILDGVNDAAGSSGMWVYYQGKDGTEYSYTSEAPSAAGKYNAETEVEIKGQQSKTYMLNMDFEIEPKALDVVWADTSPTNTDPWTYVYNGQKQAPAAALSDSSQLVGQDKCGVTVETYSDAACTQKVDISMHGESKTFYAKAKANNPNYRISDQTAVRECTIVQTDSHTNAHTCTHVSMSEDGSTITYTCGVASCEYATGNHQIGLSLTDSVVKTVTYNGTPWTAALTGENSAASSSGMGVYYQGRDGTEYSYTSEAPSATGKYNAVTEVVLWDRQSKPYMLSMDFEIEPKKIDAAWTDTSPYSTDPWTYVYSGQKQTPEASLKYPAQLCDRDTCDITVETYSDADCTKKADAIEPGTYYAKASADNNNYAISDNTAGKQFTITTCQHALTAHPAVAATHTDPGNSAYWSCSKCGKFFSDAEGNTEIEENSWVIPATGQGGDDPVEYSGTCGESLTWTLTAGGTLTISGTGQMTNYDEKDETIGPAPWKEHSSKIKKVTIEKDATNEKGATNIGTYAFNGCSNLTEITIPDTVTIIGYGSFGGCSSLTEIAIPDTVVKIEDLAFRDCSSLESIEIPPGPTRIGFQTFSGCKNLESVDLPSTIKWIDVEAFCGCERLKNVEIPSKVISFGHHAFAGCASLESADIPSGVTTLDFYIFSGCSSLKEITIPDTVTDIENNAFDGCSSLESITIPSGVTTIYFGTFRDCRSLKNIDIPSTVTTISGEAFYGCSSLESITIPSGVKKINESTFRGCSSLGSITIPSGVKSIGKQAFYDCSSLEGIEIPSGVTSIEEGTFYGCSSLESIEIPSGVKSIGSQAFYNCSGLKGIEIPSGVRSIGSQAFYSCSGLKGISIPYGVTDIADSTFFSCSNLENVTIPATVTSIGNSAFSKCSSLTNVTIPSCVTSIGTTAFNSCSNLESVVIPASVTSIGYHAFIGCSSLAYIFYSGSEGKWDSLGNVYTGDAIVHYNATGHTWRDATCTEPKKCTVCELTKGEAAGHVWGEPEYTWDDDCSKCTATRICSNDTSHIDTEKVNAVSVITEDPTCTETGKKTNTAMFSNPAFEEQKKEVEVPALGHDYRDVEGSARDATCTAAGRYTDKECTRCHDRISGDVIPSKGHTWDEGRVTAAPTQTQTGVKTYTCSDCGAAKNEPIEMLPSMTISKTMFTWNNKVQTPAVYVRVGSRALRNGTDYTVTYPKGRKNIGTYTIRVTLKNGYSGVRTASYTIAPKGSKLTGASAAKRSVTVRWVKQTGKMPKARINGYQIQYSLRKDFKSGNRAVNVGGYNNASRKINGLKSKKTYYFRVRTYMKSGGKTCYSGWSGVRAVKAK